MDRKAVKQLAQKTESELQTMAETLLVDLAKMNSDKRIGKLKDIRNITKTRHDRARILTILRQKQREEKHS